MSEQRGYWVGVGVGGSQGALGGVAGVGIAHGAEVGGGSTARWCGVVTQEGGYVGGFRGRGPHGGVGQGWGGRGCHKMGIFYIIFMNPIHASVSPVHGCVTRWVGKDCEGSGQIQRHCGECHLEDTSKFLEPGSMAGC